MTTFGSDLTSPRDEATPSSTFGVEGKTPFLSQPRAQSALRQQLATIETVLSTEIARRRALDPDSKFEMHVLPNRLVARLADAGLSFSWIVAAGGQAPTVADGRLLVIQWSGVENELRGVAALRSARPVDERVYRPEGADAEHWRWRTEVEGDAANAETYTTDDLVAAWLAASSAARPI